MLIAARFSGPGSGKDLLSRAISLIASRHLSPSSIPPVLRAGKAIRVSGNGIDLDQRNILHTTHLSG
jgi:hypothetical protein